MSWIDEKAQARCFLSKEMEDWIVDPSFVLIFSLVAHKVRFSKLMLALLFF